MAANDKAKDFDWAVKNGDLAGVKTFVEKDGVNPATLKDANSRGPVHWASDYNQLEILQYLAGRKDVKLDELDKYGITPLLAAVYEGHIEVVKFLLSKGAKKTTKGPDGKTPFEAAEKPEIKNLLK
eukprot:Phypoly_transcript_21941.p1 GENE.Phypoly_transcript_21941~~Phypoly_transcript_21941.p1  ORF type:complete len:141 (+),score=35.54 Phypoly_transcript_21941:48-425(+)